MELGDLLGTKDFGARSENIFGDAGADPFDAVVGTTIGNAGADDFLHSESTIEAILNLVRSVLVKQEFILDSLLLFNEIVSDCKNFSISN